MALLHLLDEFELVVVLGPEFSELLLFLFALLFILVLHLIVALILLSVLLELLLEFGIKLLYIDFPVAVGHAILFGPAQALFKLKFFLCFGLGLDLIIFTLHAKRITPELLW